MLVIVVNCSFKGHDASALMMLLNLKKLHIRSSLKVLVQDRLPNSTATERYAKRDMFPEEAVTPKRNDSTT